MDTNALSDVILPPGKRPAIVAKNLAEYLRTHGQQAFSEIVCYEILRGLRKKQAVTQEGRFLQFCGHSELVLVNYTVLDRAASLWAEGQRQGIVVEDGDLVIASTALLRNETLVTANTKYFSWISGLNLLNWRL